MVVEQNWKADCDRPHSGFPKEDLEVVSHFICGAIRETYELKCSLKTARRSAGVRWWNRKLAELRSEMRRAFNRAKNSKKEENSLFAPFKENIAE